jgi:hypothetical protein
MKWFLTVAAVLVGVLGFGWLLFPEAMLGRWGVGTDAVGLLVSRRYGTMLLGYALILGLARSSGASPARTAILLGGAFVTGLVALVSLSGVLTGTVGTGAWPTVIVEALLSGGFAYYALVDRGRRGSGASS